MSNVNYEWDVESVTVADTDENEAEEVLEHRHCQSFAEALHEASLPPLDGCRHDIVLVRDGPEGRSWAYLHTYSNGTRALPKYFADACDNRGTAIPRRYHDEVSKATA